MSQRQAKSEVLSESVRPFKVKDAMDYRCSWCDEALEEGEIVRCRLLRIELYSRPGSSYKKWVFYHERCWQGSQRGQQV